MSRTHYEYREPPLPYQNRPAEATKYLDTLGLYGFMREILK
jgi:hypothetical protein